MHSSLAGPGRSNPPVWVVAACCMAPQRRWTNQAEFWGQEIKQIVVWNQGHIAMFCADSPALFCYDPGTGKGIKGHADTSTIKAGFALRSGDGHLPLGQRLPEGKGRRNRP